MELWWEAIMGCWGVEERLQWTGNPGTRLGVGRNQKTQGDKGQEAGSTDTVSQQ